MKITCIVGNHPRHAFIARSIAASGFLTDIIVEEREIFMPSPPEGLDKQTSDLFMHHFTERDRVEHEMFGEVCWPEGNLHRVSYEDLNSTKIHDIIRTAKPDLLISYGCHMLSDETLACAHGEKWNCHGGLSPWYRGAITHFWPSYMLEPQMTGMTVHDLTAQLDAGDVVHQCASDLVRGDTLHMLGARAVEKLGTEMPQLIQMLNEKGTLPKKAHKTSGMLWLSSKWRPEHLHQIYTHHNDRVVDSYLDGKIKGKTPTLHRQFP